MSRGSSPHGNVRLVIQTWLVTRLMMALVAVWLMLTEGRELGVMVTNWDVAHFAAIAEHGYLEATNMAFFPGWPLFLRLAASSGLPAVAVGTLLALLASGLAAAALYRLAGAPAAIAWLLAPTAVFTMVPYTESVFCAAAFWAWERATTKHWGAAAVLTARSLLRVSGIF